jgi:TolB protein
MRFVASALALVGCLVAVQAPAAPVPKDGPPRVLAVSANHLGNWEIFLVYPESGDIKNITRNKATDLEPNWSPDGQRIAFVSDRSGENEIWVMSADGSDPKQLTEKCGGCTGLRWSPDGKKIAFTCGKSGTDHIHVADTGTGKVTALTDGETACRQPAWSADSKKLSYSYYGGGFYGTYIMDADGTNKENISGEGGGLDAHWSTDGKRITFTSVRDGNGFRVYAMDADGKSVKQLSMDANGVGNVFPRWSPDGKSVAYGEQVDGVLQIAVVGADGTGQKVITSKASHSFARWSPDGKSLAYLRTVENHSPALVVSDPDGGNAKELIHGYGSGEWRPK